jgi:tetratricopeptide (TPR) repeat protein
MLANITEALRQGDIAAALTAARAAVAAEPDSAPAQHLLGVCLQRSQDPDGARAAFERALALAPDQASVHFSLASLDLAQGRTEQATAGLRQALVLDPNQLGAYVTLIHLALARRDLPEAERNLRLAQRVSAEHPQVLVAEGYVAQARGDAEAGMRCFTAAASADPTLPAAQLALGMAFLAKGLWPFAEQALSNALALEPVRATYTLRSLAEARRRQGKVEETLVVLDELISRDPNEHAARVLRADILAATGKGEAALADYRVLLDIRPAHAHTLRETCALLLGSGQGDEARERVDAALQARPTDDELWLLRMDLSGRLGEDARALLDRWQDSAPESAACLEMLADFHQTQGEQALAEAYADRALAVNPLLHLSGLIKIQALMSRDPAEALALADRLLEPATNPTSRRNLLGWSGMALDALGRYEAAAERWRALATYPAEGQLPLPANQSAEQAPAGQVEGTLVWSPVGVRAEFVLQTAQAELGPRLRLDRIGYTGPDDGFGLLRRRPGHDQAGTAARWRQSLEALELVPATAADWLPHLDAYTLAALGGARVLALVTDPRDAFLNWIIHGSLQNYLPPPELSAAAQWLAQSLEALADHSQAHPELTTVACLDRDAGEAAGQVEAALSLTQPLPALFGPGPRFAPGHWRHYATAFAPEFASLTPVAVRLGYPLS